MPKSINNIVKKVGVVASAVGAGVLAGLMLAPKSGKETRKDIKDKLDETKDNIENKVGEMKDDIKEKSENVKKDIQEKVDNLKK